MPYIIKKDRDHVEPAIAEAVKHLKDIDFEKGSMNFFITRLVQEYILHHGKRYDTLSDVTGVLNDVKTEFERRVVAKYEDAKCKLNGDVY